MITFNDILESGCQFQSEICIEAVSHEGEHSIVFEGDGESIPCGEPWGEGYVSYIYYDAANECITIEIEQKE